ncbi:formyltetrahydrofolate deformylase [Quisquiliibacterium transsilvanicum]|uniref:Formyltetrahydrofolate deformylase n=1 Tax=Quisquiliibacterium transsilvanicum TaxID=1549638 RepID=A0A7W8HGB8_9BURK|nr:formyltetrahydrofolate deformylase [Quisquiliibacterium transsilvanicum]MBB5271579.1 formyltetrahydrofolate deformylase [Quisquiliibacterium transsilvanicum]
MTAAAPEYILTLSCPDTTGIVYHVTGFLFERGCNIIDSAQFGDASTGLFFLRVHFSAPESFDLARLQQEFAQIAERFRMDAHISDLRVRPRVMLMVSKFGHCLNDLLFRRSSGQLDIEIPAIVSNHTEFQPLAHGYRIPYFYLPVTPATKADQEAKVLELIERERIDLVVLARYMQILSPGLCEALKGRAINIHHSFLPSFKGAKPYAQAHHRGVKLIGATAHYVTPDLDEGPIIEQDVERVDHAMTPDTLAAIGHDVESVVLARAVKWHVERRVLINGHRTVVFR